MFQKALQVLNSSAFHEQQIMGLMHTAVCIADKTGPGRLGRRQNPKQMQPLWHFVEINVMWCLTLQQPVKSRNQELVLVRRHPRQAHGESAQPQESCPHSSWERSAVCRLNTPSIVELSLLPAQKRCHVSQVKSVKSLSDSHFLWCPENFYNLSCDLSSDKAGAQM